MHEMSMMSSLFDIILKKAEEYDARKINLIKVKIGALAGVVPELLESAFEVFSKNTIAEGALFKIEEVPFKVRCKNCGETKIEKKDFIWICPTCMSSDLEINSGDDLIVERMEVEVDEETDSSV